MKTIRLTRTDGEIITVPIAWIGEFEESDESPDSKTEILFKNGETILVENEASWIYDQLNEFEYLEQMEEYLNG